VSREGAGDRYLRLAIEALEGVLDTQRHAILTAGTWIAEAVAANRLLYVTGSGHSHMLAEEVFYRAGGLVSVYPILDPALMLHDAAVSSSRVERVPGIAEIRLEAAGVGPGDVLLVASNSGRNAYPVEAALVGRRLGAQVIALTSVPHSRSAASRHASGQRLFEIADLVLDTGIPPGDAAVTLDGLDVRVGPLSTVVGAALLNAVTVEAVARLVEAGVRPDLFVSANVDGTDAPAVDLEAWSSRVPPLR
jgi:uncharacterized phosphosugar-binding protein